MNFSDYIIYVDESGDHGMVNINPDYPVFVLSFCLFKVENYTQQIVPELQALKFKYFGHDQIVFHEHEIRKQLDDFGFLRLNAELRNSFLSDVSEFMKDADFEIFSIVIDKHKLKKRYKTPFNPYYLGLQFGLEVLYKHLLYCGEEKKTISLIFEKRGKREDDSLELEFRRLISGEDNFGWKNIDYSKMDINLIFADKRTNSSGLQIADLTARPIGIHYLNLKQKNRAYDIVRKKITRLKVFPE